MKRNAFTLIELLVVIAIIALLMSILMPGLNLAKKKAASAACLNNAKQMSLGWYTYQGDNDGRIMSALMENVGTQTNCKEGWIGQPHKLTDTVSSSLTLTQTAPEVTDDDEIRGARVGKLFEYLESPDVFHCPADKIRKGPDGSTLYVSYAIASCLNGFPDPANSLYNRQIRKLSDMTLPSSRYVFVESGEANRGNWIVGGRFPIAAPEYGASGYGLWAPVAISHGRSNVFGFADGHAEVHKWSESIIFDHYKATENTPPGSNYGFRVPSGPSDDITWLAKGWAYR